MRAGRVVGHALTFLRDVRSVRGMATAEAPGAAGGDRLVLTLSSPHSFYYKAQPVDQVNLCAASGDMGILAKHVPTIQQLRPGIIEVIANAQSKRLFSSGGFAVMNPDSTLNINVSEVYPLESIDAQTVQTKLVEATRLAQEATNEKHKTEAAAALEVYQALAHALASHKP